MGSDHEAIPMDAGDSDSGDPLRPRDGRCSTHTTGEPAGSKYAETARAPPQKQSGAQPQGAPPLKQSGAPPPGALPPEVNGQPSGAAVCSGATQPTEVAARAKRQR